MDLGHGLRFARHYASRRKDAISAMGKAWRHSLDWQLKYQLVGNGTTAEIVVVTRPLATKTAFQRLASSSPWAGATHGAGGITGSESDGFVYTDDDGTRVTFDRTGSQTFRLGKIQRAGEPAILVTYAGNATTFQLASATGPSLTITYYGSGHANAGRVASVSGGGQTWTYTYTPEDQRLLTATGPDLSTQSTNGQINGQIVWTYIYESAVPLSLFRLKQIDRTAGGIQRTVGSWTYDAYDRVTVTDEDALDQPLYLTYGGGQAGVDTTAIRTVAGTTSPAVATLTCDDRRLTGAVAGSSSLPGFMIPFAQATPTRAQGVAPASQWKVVTDLNGNQTAYAGYDLRGRPGTIVDGWIDSNGNGTLDASDASTRRRDYTYHPTLDQPLTVTQKSVLNPAADRVETQIFDGDRLMTRRLAGFTLDASGGVIPFTDNTTYGYDANGRITSITGPTAADYTEIDYDPPTGSRSALRRYLNGSGSSYLAWSFSNFNGQGNPQTVTDPNGRSTGFTYDGLGRVLTATPPYEGTGSTTTTFTYDVDGNLTRIDFPPDSFSQAVYLSLIYDAAKPSLLRAIADSKGNAIVYTHDRGRVRREERYTGFTDLASPGTRVGDAQFEISTAGRMIHAFNPLFPSNNVHADFDYDPKGNPKSVADENGKHDVLLYDALDRLKKIQQMRSATYETGFGYDTLSNVINVTDAAGKATDLLHDDRGNLVETTSPDTGTTRFLYDAAGNLVKKIENAPASGTQGARITSYTYDGLNRLTRIDLPNDPDWVFTYDTSAATNQKGRLAQVTNGTVTTQLEYTYRGDVAAERTVIGGMVYPVFYAYDAAGNRKVLTTPSGVQVSTLFAGLRPNVVSATSRNYYSQGISGIAWYPFGPRTQATFPPAVSGASPVESKRTVNLRGQIEELTVKSGSTSILNRSYRYAFTGGGAAPTDPGPNLDQVIDNRDSTESRFYFYDELDRLQKATTVPGGNVVNLYWYDAVGNRTAQIDPLVSTGYSYESGTNRLDSATSSGAMVRDYAHDAYGNRIYEGAAAFTGTASLRYDDSNRLVEVRDPTNGFATRALYTYDAFGRRVRKVAGGRTVVFVYDTEGHLIEEADKTSTPNDVVRTYVYVEDELVGLVDDTTLAGYSAFSLPGGWRIDLEPPLVLVLLSLGAGLAIGAATRRWPVGIATTSTGFALLLLCAGTGRPPPRFYWVHTDPLGTPLAVTNTPASGNAVAIWRATYEPFGKATVNQDPDGDGSAFSLNVRFPGQYADGESGYYFNRFRTFDPNTGRYVEPDPLGVTASSNLYLYVAGRPMGAIDPTGLTESGAGNLAGTALGLGSPFAQAKLDCLLRKLGRFLGVPFVGVAGPFAGVLKGGAMMGLGGTMVVGGTAIAGAGVAMTIGAVGGGALAGIPTMAAGGSIGGSGAALAIIGSKVVAQDLHEAAQIFEEECECDKTTKCCVQKDRVK